MRYLIVILLLVSGLANAQNSAFVSVGSGVSAGTYETYIDKLFEFSDATGHKYTVKPDYKYSGISISPMVMAGYRIGGLSIAAGGRYVLLTPNHTKMNVSVQGKKELDNSSIKSVKAPMLNLRLEYDLIKSSFYLAPVVQGNYLTGLNVDGNKIDLNSKSIGYGFGLGIGYQLKQIDFVLTPMYNTASAEAGTSYTTKLSLYESGAEIRIGYRFSKAE